jgi:dihydroorotase
MHEGRWSARLGLRGMPATSESGPLAVLLEAVRLDVAAAARQEPQRTPCPVHVQHVSTAAAVRLLRQAKADGLPLTAEAAPHHLLLTDELVATFDTSLRVNPPLRSEADRLAVVAALADGTIDCVGTDHAPHAPQEKEVPFEEALPGCVGLETAFPALYGGLVVPGALSLERLVDALSAAPSRCLGLPAPRLETGAVADLCVVDLDEAWTVGLGDLRGKGRNSPFLGRSVQGRVVMTVVGGARRYERAS